MLTALTVELIFIMDDMRTAKCKAVIGIKPFRNINYAAIGKTCEFFFKYIYKCFLVLNVLSLSDNISNVLSSEI